MAEQTVMDPLQDAPFPNSQSAAGFDAFDIPFDPPFFSLENGQNIIETFDSDFSLDFGLEDNGAFELTFDDLEDLCIPGEDEEFIIPDQEDPLIQTNSGSESSGISADHSPDVAANYLKNSPSESGNYQSDDQKPDFARVLKVPSGGCENSGDREISVGPVSSQGSGNGGGDSGMSHDMNCPSPDNSIERDVSSRLLHVQKVKVEEARSNSASKRKKDREDATTNSELRNSKCRKSSPSSEKSNSACNIDSLNEEEEKRKARLMRNRESAQLSRQRKKHYVEELEEKVRNMHSTIADLNSKISFIMAENVSLKQQLGGGGGMCPQPPPGLYPPPPMGHMAYPWIPCSPYVMKPQGSQVPLIPIPRLKAQQPVSAPKSKKADGKKREGRTKKVASVSFLGLLFFILFFGGLVPTVNVRFGGIGDRVPGGIGHFNGGVYDEHRGRVFTANGRENGTHQTTKSGLTTDRMNPEMGQHGDEVVQLRNGSGPLVASLYVPRNNELVKIDGNLIIHSVLASEKAKSFSEVKNEKSTDLVMLRKLASALAIPEAQRKRAAHSYVYGNLANQRRALAPGSDDPLKDHIKKSISANGKVQQWFREGLAGPMLNTGMCSEVFRFDVTPSSSKGVIIPAPSAGNITSENHHNSTGRVLNGRHRRSLRGKPFPLPASQLNDTEKGMRQDPKEENFHEGNKSLSSMVVSVLIDPREAVDIEVNGAVPPPKSLSRIFVVVLLDSIKYVTYSCGLPHLGGGPHLVTT
ncbi:hypothetical protein SAY87_030439 [Trapa incisa]|uniref:BZIP domain-containing protein n=1 Tax=Trapa incisa TaxID=236973 RepID=A0AAN7QJN4_9MYRT|nr:hypothetical protein SAY87_030439 [Trapa incisa]